MRITLLAAAFGMAMASSSAFACTTVLVGSEATADGSIFIARSVDSSSLNPSLLVMHPAAVNKAGSKYRGSDNPEKATFEYPLPAQTFGYSTGPDWDSHRYGGCGFNDAGLGVSATESIYASDEVLKLDPYEKLGIKERDIADVILAQAKTAKEGAALLGRIVETQGAGESFGVGFVDKDEAWYFEAGSGHQWLAQRLPKDKYFATGNQGRLQQYDPQSPDFMASATLVSWAQEHGFYDPKKDGAFNFAEAYIRNDDRDVTYNYPRVWQIQKMLTPSLKQDIAQGTSFPVFAAPEKKVTLADMKAILRNHYEAGELISHDPYSKGLRGDEPYRPISVFRAQNTHVLQVRPELPQAIGQINWFALGMSDLSVYVPFYQGLTQFPKSYSSATDEADDESAYWKFRKLQTLVMTDYPTLAPIVKQSFAEFEAQTEEKCRAFEAEYLKLAKSNPQVASKLLDDFNLGIANEAVALAGKLTNKIYTQRTKDIEAAAPFKNRKKND
ncbi:C69 family dipeptidase [uncultured Sutterella sp.]|uniref:C69 family dipeptidase n=1 Tax=uncultured Sutterella sp. TaxID=286133 RepID=UPI00259BAD2A|nr:C69 family dipeptidase [uncultured Sutterella sp.]